MPLVLLISLQVYIDFYSVIEVCRDIGFPLPPIIESDSKQVISWISIHWMLCESFTGIYSKLLPSPNMRQPCALFIFGTKGTMFQIAWLSKAMSEQAERLGG